MKKLMIAAAIVCAAAMSQAATYDWNFSSGVVYAGYNASNVGGTSTVKETGATAYLIYYGGGADDTQLGITQSALLAELRKGTAITDSSLSKYILTTAQTGDTDAKIAEKAFKADSGKTYLSGSSLYMKAYLAIVDGDYVYLSATSDGLYDSQLQVGAIKPSTGTSAYLRDNDGTKAWDSTKAGWYSTVPEPTSGLLLLLGVAGLALRRRRA